MREYLLTNETADGDGTIITWSGGGAVLDFSGTLDGATATISIDVGAGYNYNPTDMVLSALGVYSLNYIPTGALVKATVASAGATTDLNLIIISL